MVQGHAMVGKVSHKYSYMYSSLLFNSTLRFSFDFCVVLCFSVFFRIWVSYFSYMHVLADCVCRFPHF
jgi:hypothetical protein